MSELKLMVKQMLDAQQKPVSSSGTSASNAESEASDIWSDPDKYIDKKFDKKLGEALSKAQQENARGDAEEWILSQDGVDRERDYDELAALSKSLKLDAMATVYPEQASELLYLAWKSAKGIQKNNPSKNQAAAVQGNPAASGGKKIFSTEWVQKLAITDPTKYDEIKDELKIAAQEGRIR